MYWLSGNPCVTPEFVESHPNGLYPGKWNKWYMRGLSQNLSITPEFVENHPP
jgi:hypothetical protein